MRRIPLSRRSHIIGFQPLPTGVAEHESALERDFVTRVSFEDPTAVITSQPVTIDFRSGPQRRRYTPDFMLRRSNGVIELVEVKYFADWQAQRAHFEPAFAAARVWAREHGATFRIDTEAEIRGASLDNARRLLPLRAAPLDPQLMERALAAARKLANPTLGTILAQLPVDRSTALSTLWRLIARGALRVDLAAKITLDTRILNT